MATIDAPVLNDSITNKQATQNSSLYHACRYVLQALSTIHHLQPYLTVCDRVTSTTPMTRLWHFCRQGTTLCILFNILQPDAPIPYDESSSLTEKQRKAYVYSFLVACRDQLHFRSDSLFTLRELFEDDTNGFVRVLNLLKRVVQKMVSQGIITAPSLDQDSVPTTPKSNRDKIVMELLETERKYVQDLEILQNYMDEARTKAVLPPNTLHQLFGNLGAMVDCQRKFLVQAEDQALSAPENQRFGLLFINNENAFSVYEPFCANFQTAQNLVNREAHALENLSHLLSSTFELPSFLIKPVQRICKYPLLMKELVKTTPPHWPFYDETKQGLDAIQRVAAKVNETNRLQENLATLQLLKEQIDDFPLSNIDDFGALLVHDKFMVYRGDPGRELLVYLFEKCLFLCREEKDKDGISNNKKAQKKAKKNLGGSNMAESSSSGGGQSVPVRLIVRGKILISRVAQVMDSSQDGTCFLEIFWSEKHVNPGQNFCLDSITLKCRHIEQLQLWESSLNGLIKQSKKYYHHHHPLDSGVSTMIDSPQLLSPSVTISHSMSRLDSNASGSHYDNREDDGHRLREHHNNTGQQQTHQPLLRQLSHNAAYDMTPKQFLHGTRMSPSITAQSSPTQLHPYRDFDPSQSIPTTEFFTQQLLSEQYNDSQDDYFNRDYDAYSPSIHTPQTPQTCTYTSQHQHHALEKQLPAIMPNNNGSIPLRFRSQSSPNIHPSQSNHTDVPLPPLPNQHHQHQHHRHYLSQPQQNADIPGIVKFGKRRNNEDQDLTKHLPTLNTTSDSSNLTAVHPHQYDQIIQQLNVASSYTSELSNTKVKVHHMGNIYAFASPLTIDYKTLVDRIERKMKCDISIINPRGLISSGLCYEDEVGDLVQLRRDDDLQLALETNGKKNSLNLYIV